MRVLDGAAGAVQRIDLTLTPGSAEEFGLIVRANGAHGTRIGIRPAQGTLHVDRRTSGNTSFHESFPSIDTAPVSAIEGSYRLTIFVDRCSLEVFAEEGRVTMTELIFSRTDEHRRRHLRPRRHSHRRKPGHHPIRVTLQHDLHHCGSKKRGHRCVSGAPAFWGAIYGCRCRNSTSARFVLPPCSSSTRTCA
ncbi:GH32 C-terminal domain-containing protein [Arthrobacter sp. HS15c]|uniref:GH32 C-terminal domain-containing protein n=1 Tax=Arthrobacter sp. HS15c TaxID=3230279 RepID=UPI003466E29D